MLFQKKYPTKLEQSHLRTTVAIRSLLSRSRVDWAIEAARRVGAEPVGALGEERGFQRISGSAKVGVA